MGQEFGSDGKLIKYSNLFNYNSLEELQASTWLPTPRGIKIRNNLEEPGLNINNRLQLISQVLGIDNAKVLRIKADLIIDIYNYLDQLPLELRGLVNLVYDDKYSHLAKENVIKDLITHERTVISPNLEESAYKNSVSSNIKNIVLDLENMTMAYQPINMDDLSTLAGESEKGAMTAHMSLMNPLTKYIMQVQNMVGKKVIGITAVGEKVFFNLSYYYNEGVRSGDTEWERNMKFYKKFNRILNRYNAAHGNGLIESAIKTSLANVNFTGFEDVRSRFVIAALVDAKVRKEMGVTDSDIQNQTELWLAYRERMNLIANNPEERNRYSAEVMNSSPVDLLISLLLSAATDNAKELILSKINAGDNLAKCHLYLLMVGFDIKDVVTFMTTPYVNLVNALSESNMMDNFMSKVSVQDAIKLSLGIINPSNFLFGTKEINDEERGFITRTREEIVFANFRNSQLNKTLLEDLKAINPKATSIRSLSTFILLYIQRRVNGDNLKRLADYSTIFEYETRKQLNSLSDYVDKLVYLILKAKSKYQDPADFDADQVEFERILKLADETSTLGGTFLGLNQGLPSSKEDLLKSVRNIGNAITTREKEFGIYASMFESPAEKVRDVLKAVEAKLEKYQELLNVLYDNNPFLAETIVDSNSGERVANLDHIDRTIRLAHLFGLVGNFDFEAWINDKNLTIEDAKNTIFINQDISNILSEGETVSYRTLVSDYYNLIKGTWNIFDVINRVPLYKSILNLYSFIYTMDKNVSTRSHLINSIYDKVMDKSGFIDDRQSKTISTYANDLLITSFFRDNNYSFPVYEGMDYLDSKYITTRAKHGLMLDLNSASGRAAFKKVFEGIIPQLLKTGRYGDTVIPDYLNNRLLLDLGTFYEKDGTPKLSLELDMMKLNATPNSLKVFQQYLNGLEQLKKVKIGDVSFTDWLILYNLYVNLNQYGSDRFTTIFKNSLINSDSVLTGYFKYIGDLDYSRQNDDLLKSLDFNIEDLLIRMAPIVSLALESFAKAPYIKVRTRSGEVVVKLRTRKGYYRTISTFPDNDMLDFDQKEDLKYNYQIYQMIKMKNLDFNTSLRIGLQSNNLETLLDTIRTYTQRGILKIYKENC